MRVMIGFDEREAQAAEVAAKSLLRVTHNKLQPEFLCVPKLTDHGLLTRIHDRRDGWIYDLVSNESTSTEFKCSRFLTPILCQSGMALFVDCDVVFHRDPREMLLSASSDFAVSVVKHASYTLGDRKMDGQSQTPHPRKWWSSVMLFNCDHAANRRLSLRDVNERKAFDLHNFYWLADSEIGSLEPRWGWLVDVQPRPPMVGIAHMTLGGPWLPGWKGGSYDEEWATTARDTV